MSWIIHDPLTRLLAQVVAVVVVARLLARLLRPARQPLVVAEIAAGILLGPSLLGWLAPDASAVLFAPASLGTLQLVSQLGLVLFMFLVGLELDPRLLRGRGHASVFISHTSIVVPFALGVGLSAFLHERYAPDVPFWAFASFMGAAMSITAFPVLARILTERRLDRTRVGAITITCAAIDDVTAWCILAFVVALTRAQGFEGAVWTTVSALGYVLLMFFAARPLLKRLAARFTRPGTLSQNVVAAMVVGAFLSSWATERIGIHALFGAFLFGAILPKDGGFARVVAEKLEELVLIVLLPLFFAYSGLRTDVRLLGSPEHWGVAVLIVVVACAGKFGGALLPARWSGLGWRESAALAILMNTRGLMELIVLNIGLDLGVISPTVFSMMVLMALVTTVATTPLLERFYPQRLMAQDVIDAAPVGAADGPRNGGALLCVADARTGPSLVTLAAALERDARSSSIQALHLSPAGERASDRMGEDGSASGVFAPLLARAGELGTEVSTLSFVSTDPAEDIARVAEVRGTELVLLGLHKPMFTNVRLGGVVHGVLRATPARVGVLLARSLGRIERVLVPYQGGEHDRAALDIARRLQAGGARVTLLHVVPPGRGGATAATTETIDAAFEGRTGTVVLEVVEGQQPAEVVLARSATGFDLVVVGFGREWGLTGRRYGLQGELLLERGTTSVLVVRERRGATP